MEIFLRRFDEPDEFRVFEKGRFEIVRIGGLTLARATYELGWKWSTDLGASLGATHCDVEYVGLVLSGHASTLAQLSSGTAYRAASTERRRAAGIGEGRVGLSVGLGRADDILEDLERGLRRV